MPGEIKTDRLRSAEDEIEQTENDVVSADHGHEDGAREPANHREDRGETMSVGIDRGGNIETREKQDQQRGKTRPEQSARRDDPYGSEALRGIGDGDGGHDG